VVEGAVVEGAVVEVEAFSSSSMSSASVAARAASISASSSSSSSRSLILFAMNELYRCAGAASVGLGATEEARDSETSGHEQLFVFFLRF
jgi:hypothetical protein